MSDGKLTRDERTTPVGLFHFAISYQAAAKILSKELTRDHVTHPDAPPEFLLIHSIELYLKAYLRLKGYSLSQLKGELGHDYSKLADQFEQHGGALSSDDRAILESLTPASVFGTRYIVVGISHMVDKGQLDLCADRLRQFVRGALKAAGEPVR